MGLDDERWTMDDGRWRLANSTILYCLPGKDWALWISYPGLHPGLLPLRSVASSRRTVSRWRLANRRRRRRRYRPQPTVTGRDGARNVSTEIATQTQKCRDVARNVSTAGIAQTQKKEPTSLRLTPESGGYLLSRNSVPSAIASLTSLFGMGRGGTSLP